MTVRYIVGDTRDVLATIPDGSVDLVMTSPPFLAQRSYLPDDHPDKHLEMGCEPDPATFIDNLLALTADWRRVLAPHGTICVELGDTYSGSGGAGGDYGQAGMREGQEAFRGSAYREVESAKNTRVARHDHSNSVRSFPPGGFKQGGGPGWPLAKCMTLVPELYRIGLAYGINPITGQASPAGRWRVRNVVRWVRPNPPVGALGDKFRPATSDLVIACTAIDRWFDLDAVRSGGEPVGGGDSGTSALDGGSRMGRRFDVRTENPAGAPPLDWWKISPSGFAGAHYATFPAELCHKPIEAMCPRRVCRTCGKPSRRETETEYVKSTTGAPHDTTQIWAQGSRTAHTKRAIGEDNGVTALNTTTGWSTCGCPGTDGIRLDGYHTGTGWRPGMVLDPFVGSGTTLMVSHGLSRDAIGIDLDRRNVDLAYERLGMFLEVDEPGTAA